VSQVSPFTLGLLRQVLPTLNLGGDVLADLARLLCVLQHGPDQLVGLRDSARDKPLPADDVRFREVTEMRQVLTKKLGLGNSVTGWHGFLPDDPQRIISGSWVECAREWFR
jgi:hypothetical protein